MKRPIKRSIVESAIIFYCRLAVSELLVPPSAVQSPPHILDRTPSKHLWFYIGVWGASCGSSLKGKQITKFRPTGFGRTPASLWIGFWSSRSTDCQWSPPVVSRTNPELGFLGVWCSLSFSRQGNCWCFECFQLFFSFFLGGFAEVRRGRRKNLAVCVATWTPFTGVSGPSKVSRRVFLGWGSAKRPPKIPQKVEKCPQKSHFQTFWGIFRLSGVFSGTFLQTPKKTLFETLEGPEPPVNGGSGRNVCGGFSLISFYLNTGNLVVGDRHGTRAHNHGYPIIFSCFSRCTNIFTKRTILPRSNIGAKLKAPAINCHAAKRDTRQQKSTKRGFSQELPVGGI